MHGGTSDGSSAAILTRGVLPRAVLTLVLDSLDSREDITSVLQY